MRKLFFLISSEDLASVNMGEVLKERWDEFTVFDVEFVEIGKLHLYLTNEDIKEIGIDGPILVLSAHSSEKEVKSLTVHTPGNFRENPYGGEKEKISYSNPILQTVLLRELYENNPFSEFQVSFEVTHHGPSLDIPITFYEIGSTEREWKDKKIAEFMIENLLRALPRYFEILKNFRGNIAFGVGGPHYAPNFTKFVIKNQDYFIGHIMPKYAINLKEEVLSQLMKRNFPREAGVCVIDWKGLKGEERRAIYEYFFERGLEIIKIK